MAACIAAQIKPGPCDDGKAILFLDRTIELLPPPPRSRIILEAVTEVYRGTQES